MPIPTMRKVLRSKEPRFKFNSRFERLEKLTSQNIQGFIKAVIKLADDRTLSYMILIKKFKIQASENIICKTLR